ncbi:MAG: hypothetical protein LBP22_17220 [Deltaproteobacteria bacterium]|jgi:flagellar motility protein MotE (MotC chaperone)|nr:hypothetical protein [Deltaproteobacteria bacterium]
MPIKKNNPNPRLKPKPAPTLTAAGNKTSTQPVPPKVSDRKPASPPVPADSRNSALTEPHASGQSGGIFSKIRLLFILALVILILRLAIAGLYLNSGSDSKLPKPPKPPTAGASTAQAATAAQVSASPAALPPNALVAGAAMFLNTQAASLPVAQGGAVPAANSIPLPPGEEDLRSPQAPVRPATPTPAQAQPGQSLPPPPANPSAGEAGEISRRSFELTRRETQLNTREQALKEMEANANSRSALAEKSIAELKDLISRNEAILDEQKALRQQQKTEEDALKDARVEHLVLAFKGMKPEQAGQLINSMDDAVAVSILSAMPGSNAGKILAMVQPDKAARLIKSISEQRIDPKTILEQQNAQVQPANQ